MSANRTIVVFGSGPGIGRHVAAEFASHGFNHVILLARNESRLQEDKEFVTKASPDTKVDILTLDLSDLKAIPPVLEKISQLAPKIDVVFFNAARIQFSDVLTTPVEEIEEDFKISNLALYIVSQWGIPRLQDVAKTTTAPKPALLVTNSHLPWDPIPQLLSLSLTKASQANMVQSFSRAFPDIHSGLIRVEGTVTPESKVLAPSNIAKETYKFYEGGEGLDLNLRE